MNMRVVWLGKDDFVLVGQPLHRSTIRKHDNHTVTHPHVRQLRSRR